MLPRKILGALGALLILAAVAASANAAVLTGPVVRVVDGDTLEVEGSGMVWRVRLRGIDAPEHDQAFGSEATANLKRLVAGKTVSVDYEHQDRYHRIVGKVMLGSEDICLDQVKAGLAWHYKYYENEQTAGDRKLYSQAEKDARQAKLGLWSGSDPIPPWDFRHGLVAAPHPRWSGEVEGNRRSHIFEWPGCPYYGKVSSSNRVTFASSELAEQAGYRPARNCP